MTNHLVCTTRQHWTQDVPVQMVIVIVMQRKHVKLVTFTLVA